MLFFTPPHSRSFVKSSLLNATQKDPDSIRGSVLGRLLSLALELHDLKTSQRRFSLLGRERDEKREKQKESVVINFN